MKAQISKKLEEALGSIREAMTLAGKDLLVVLYLEEAELSVERAKKAHEHVMGG